MLWLALLRNDIESGGVGFVLRGPSPALDNPRPRLLGVQVHFLQPRGDILGEYRVRRLAPSNPRWWLGRWSTPTKRELISGRGLQIRMVSEAKPSNLLLFPREQPWHFQDLNNDSKKEKRKKKWQRQCPRCVRGFIVQDLNGSQTTSK